MEQRLRRDGGGGGVQSGAIQNSHVSDTNPEGGDQPHNNVQPSIIVNMWQRVA